MTVYKMTSDERLKLNVIDKTVNGDKQQQQQQHRLENGIDAPMDDKHLATTKGDRTNLALLLLLYILQGIPISISAAMSMLLQKRGASYQAQAQFSFIYWPFTLKLLWAPIVDACYFARFGRRKSWLVPVQFSIGLFMLAMSVYIEEWLGNKDNPPRINILCCAFFLLTFLAATQDICTDGWSLVLLRTRNLGYASICSSVGYSIASFFGYCLLVSLESPEFCNTWLRKEPQDVGFITVAGFLWVWGLIYLVSTTLIAILKSETRRRTSTDRLLVPKTDHNQTSILDTYKLGLKILWIPSIKILSAILLSVKFTWSAYEGVSFFKFFDAGVSNEKMIPLSAFSLVPVRLIVPFLMAKYVASANPTDLYIRFIPYRSFFAGMAALFVWIAPFTLTDGVAPAYIYFVFLANEICYMFCVFSMNITMTAVFLKNSDPAVGGTYMTMLNTIDNFGTLWPITLALWAVEHLTWRNCGDFGNELVVAELRQNGTEISPAELNRLCPIVVDGYYVEAIICLLFGFLWYRWGVSKVRYLQRVPLESWRVVSKEEKELPRAKSERIEVS